MNNNELLKRHLKQPLDSDKIITERLNEFLSGILEAGKLIGDKDAYERGYAAGREDEYNISKKGGQ